MNDLNPSTLGFDLEYDLQVLKEDLADLFDENGKRYTGVNLSNRQAESMYEMIIRLENYASQLLTCKK